MRGRGLDREDDFLEKGTHFESQIGAFFNITLIVLIIVVFVTDEVFV